MMRAHKRGTNYLGTDRTRLLALGTLFGFVAGALLMSAFRGSVGRWSSYRYSFSSVSTATPIQLKAILHYATSKVVPQQSLKEVTESYNVLQTLGSCNFLVFGLGHDSLMWAALNPNGTTLFLEESPEWVTSVLKGAPFLNAITVSYKTRLREADKLLETYREEPDCRPERAFLKGNRHCKLALDNLPEEVYEREWDVIMIDAPRGYSPEHPGRMAAIFSAAVMTRERKGVGNTHIFLHDVDRKVEETFAKEFLCMKYKVGSVGRLWHFEIPPVTNHNNAGSINNFC
ncbi:probable methyltransferase At1g27930 [Chenopodium quinoa]|uniref:probable methyltransferase At1g27930 n=1 Tax=Chenopodium quinoa TaxID=63459 RepID=UPI000B77AFCF|nr:probable methyltransferase At1g27930 [Chenopodium quinoa]